MSYRALKIHPIRSFPYSQKEERSDTELQKYLQILSLIFLNLFIQYTNWIQETDFVRKSAVSITVNLYETDLPRSFKCVAQNKTNNSQNSTIFIRIPAYPGLRNVYTYQSTRRQNV